MSAEESAAAGTVTVSEPELLPVPASVFDDDFFRREPIVEGPMPVRREPEMPVITGQRVFAGAAVGGGDAQDTDELDIPAFLRKGH
jgi:cell division protein FtsZ